VLIVKRVWWYAVKTGVWPPLVVEGDIVTDRLSGLGHRAIGFEIYLFILDGSPEAFHKDIASPTPFAIHADADMVLLELAGKGLARKLAPLVGVEDLRSAIS